MITNMVVTALLVVSNNIVGISYKELVPTYMEVLAKDRCAYCVAYANWLQEQHKLYKDGRALLVYLPEPTGSCTCKRELVPSGEYQVKDYSGRVNLRGYKHTPKAEKIGTIGE